MMEGDRVVICLVPPTREDPAVPYARLNALEPDRCKCSESLGKAPL